MIYGMVATDRTAPPMDILGETKMHIARADRDFLRTYHFPFHPG